MKTRIISGVVGFCLFLGALAVYATVFPPIMNILVCVMAAIAAYEMLYATGCVKNKLVTALGVVAAVLVVLRVDGISPLRTVTVAAVYAAAVLLIALVRNKDIAPTNAAFAVAVPIALGLAFRSALCLLNMGYIYFWLIFVYAWGSDIGAYFTGKFFGRHKLAPVLSPKKTVEGLVGGIVLSLVITALSVICFTVTPLEDINWLLLIPMSVLFSVAGTVGDLAASYVKRYFGIKDYGKIMPGHGGIMDRFDSVVMIAPLMYIFF